MPFAEHDPANPPPQSLLDAPLYTREDLGGMRQIFRQAPMQPSRRLHSHRITLLQSLNIGCRRAGDPFVWVGYGVESASDALVAIFAAMSDDEADDSEKWRSLGLYRAVYQRRSAPGDFLRLSAEKQEEIINVFMCYARQYGDRVWITDWTFTPIPSSATAAKTRASLRRDLEAAADSAIYTVFQYVGDNAEEMVIVNERRRKRLAGERIPKQKEIEAEKKRRHKQEYLESIRLQEQEEEKSEEA